MLDRERFPRYHVGESLIPAFMRPMQEMGLTERMDARGFERKYGGTLVWGNNLGAVVIEDATVKEPVLVDGRVSGVRFALRGLDGLHEVRAQLVVDASGQARVLGRRLTEVEWHDELRNVAVWTTSTTASGCPATSTPTSSSRGWTAAGSGPSPSTRADQRRLCDALGHRR